jgi:hypothetical protein
LTPYLNLTWPDSYAPAGISFFNKITQITTGGIIMHLEEKTTTTQTEPEGETLVSRRDILKVAWTAPVVLAVSPPLSVLAGSGTGPGNPPPVDPPKWDKSSIKVTARCSGDTAIFTIKNGGDDMAGPSEWRAYEDNGSLTLIDSDNFQLEAGDSIEVSIPSGGKKIRLIADQRPGHPGHSEPQADIICGSNEAHKPKKKKKK